MPHAMAKLPGIFSFSIRRSRQTTGKVLQGVADGMKGTLAYVCQGLESVRKCTGGGVLKMASILLAVPSVHPNLLRQRKALFSFTDRLTDSVRKALCCCKLLAFLYIEG